MFMHMVTTFTAWFRSEPAISLKDASQLKAKLVYLKNRRRYATDQEATPGTRLAPGMEMLRHSAHSARQDNRRFRNRWSLTPVDYSKDNPVLTETPSGSIAPDFRPATNMRDAGSKLEELLRTGCDHFTSRD